MFAVLGGNEDFPELDDVSIVGLADVVLELHTVFERDGAFGIEDDVHKGAHETGVHDAGGVFSCVLGGLVAFIDDTLGVLDAKEDVSCDEDKHQYVGDHAGGVENA